jgi:uncharacterized protein YbjT (DUF2867 family)
MILVTGATGRTGSEVVRTLLGRGVAVRALVRDRQRARLVLAAGAELAEGDLDRPETLGAALAGGERVFLLSPPDLRQVVRERGLVSAAARAGARHVVKMSAIGASLDSPVTLLRWHREIEDTLERSGLVFTHLRPHYFMQNTPRLAPSIHDERIVRVPMDGGRISIVDTRDVAAVAVAALTEDGHEGAAYVITGPEALGYDDIVTAIGDAIGVDVRYVPVTPEEARARFTASGMPGWIAGELVSLYRLFAGGAYAEVTDVVARVGHVTPRTYAQFAAEHAAVFRGT